MTDVAKAAGVSPMTVSRALKMDSSVARETREKVLRVVEKLGYVPDLIAGGLSSKRSGFVAVLVPSLNNPHFADTVSALTDTLADEGLQVLIGHTNYRPELEERLVEAMLRRRPEVVVLTYDGHTSRTEKLLSTAGIPVIEIWERPSAPIGHVVGFSNRAVVCALTQQLIAKGRKKIAFIGETNDRGTRGAERRAGVKKALRAAGLDTERMIAFAPPPMNMAQGSRALGMLLEQWPDTDAVVCVSDPCAFGVLMECQRRRVDVPKRLAIAGFGDFEVSRSALPALSTVAVDGLLIGRRTGELILELRASAGRGGTLTPQMIEIPVATVERDST